MASEGCSEWGYWHGAGTGRTCNSKLFLAVSSHSSPRHLFSGLRILYINYCVRARQFMLIYPMAGPKSDARPFSTERRSPGLNSSCLAEPISSVMARVLSVESSNPERNGRVRDEYREEATEMSDRNQWNLSSAIVSTYPPKQCGIEPFRQMRWLSLHTKGKSRSHRDRKSSSIRTKLSGSSKRMTEIVMCAELE